MPEFLSYLIYLPCLIPIWGIGYAIYRVWTWNGESNGYGESVWW